MKRIYFYLVLMLALIQVASAADLPEGKPRAIALAKRRDVERNREVHVQNAHEKQAASIREAERIRNLPPHVAMAMAHGTVVFEELEFTDDGELIDNGLVPVPPQQRPELAARESHRMLRVGGFALSVLLLVVGFALRRRQPIESVVMPRKPLKGKKDQAMHNLEE